jgi:peptidoglycan hydrolase-like protein with peptidoglycan-binding domain
MKINNFKKIFKLLNITLLILFLNINLSFAQDNAAVASQNFKETANNLTNNVLATAGTLLMTAAFVLFFYGVVVFIYERATGKNSEQELKKGKDFMLWGLIALFVMVSAWGIIRLAQNLLDIKSSDITIQPVQFAALSGNSSNSVTSNSNPLTTNNKGDFNTTPTNPLQTDSSGTTRENPFANTDVYPVIKVGYNNQPYLQKLFTGLNNHKCVDTMKSFGTTYDDTDADIVKNFQKTNGLTADGIVGKDTWEALAVSTGQKTTFTGITVKNCGGQ